MWCNLTIAIPFKRCFIKHMGLVVNLTNKWPTNYPHFVQIEFKSNDTVCCLYSSGQGFAFKRKQKVKHEYNKLLRKEKKKNPESNVLYKEEYPEHLRHLYMAEAEKLKHEAWTNRVNRTKLRMKGQEKRETTVESDAAVQQTETAANDPEVAVGSEATDSVIGNPEPTTAPENER